MVIANIGPFRACNRTLHAHSEVRLTSLVGASALSSGVSSTTKSNRSFAIDAEGAKERKVPDSSVGINDDYWPSDVNSPATIERARALALRPALDGFRARLAESWSPDTAYPGSVTPSDWSAGNPQGQCGVSSVWLAAELAREYSILSTFCQGSLFFHDDQTEDLLDHCWLEITAEPEELILDLTCDQARGFDREIVFDSKSDLDQERIYYISRDRVDISDLPSTPVWPRYQELLRNIAA